MLVSWKWLSKYVDMSMEHDELVQRLSLSGLNHEESEKIGDDISIDLEVTSNRGDCLGHIGVAREISVLYGKDLCVPEPNLQESSGENLADLLSVKNDFSAGCSRYTARVIKGVKIGPSPDWMIEALQSAFWKRRKDGDEEIIETYKPINNVVDITNYVLMECGQPLHAFDHAKVAKQQIIVRPAGNGEKILAIDHKEYELEDWMCVIADADAPIAVAGVMGGAESEVDENTTDVVIEAAVFDPLTVRRTARKLKLHSPSSYRFERKVDPATVQWASKRACELIVELAGGMVVQGSIDTAPEIPKRKPIVLRLSEVERILGIKISAETIKKILGDLGCKNDEDSSFVPPTWRHDLTREVDFIEEVARIHGYEKIPEDSPIPVAPSQTRPFDTAMQRIRMVLTSAGMSEAMTPSVVTTQLDKLLSPWTKLPALQTQTQMLKGSKRLRRTLIPSLLQSRAKNWTQSTIEANLFEIAHIYLPSESGDTLPQEVYSLGLIAGGDFFELKGIVETLVQRMGISKRMIVTPVHRDGFAEGTVVEIRLEDVLLGYLGMLDARAIKPWKLPPPVIAAELSLPVLLDEGHLVPQQQSVSPFPSVQRDLNFVLAEKTRWVELENVVRAAIGEELVDLSYRETYRDEKRDGKDRKRVLLSVELQRQDSTLSGQQADDLIQQVIGACKEKLNADLVM